MSNVNWKQEITTRVGDVDPWVLEELAQHLEARFDELGSYEAVMQEWSADDLRAELGRIRQRRAPVQLGAPGASFLPSVWQDLRYGARQLRLNPGFAAVAVLSLALGIGANTAIFQLLDAVRLRVLPVQNPKELYNIKLTGGESRCCQFSFYYAQSTFAMWEQVKSAQKGFSSVFAWTAGDFDLSTGGQTNMARGGLLVSGDFYSTLGVRPALGRLIEASDDTRGCSAPGAVLSHSYWRRAYGGDPGVIGRKISLNNHPFEVIGVSERSFTGPEVGRSYPIAIPLCAEILVNPQSHRLTDNASWWLVIMGRLKPGWTIDSAKAQLKTASPGIFAAAVYPKWSPDKVKAFLDFKLTAVPAAEGLSKLRRQYQDPLTMLLAISGLVLLIACANLANLMLARASTRQKEIAIRLALGASRGRLIRQLLVESLLLSVAGAAAGAFLARNLSQFLISFISTEGSPVFVDLAIDWRVFAFLTALAVVTCLLFGLVPALRATRTSPSDAMKAGTRGAGGDRNRARLNQMLVVSQVSLSLVLLVGSLLFIRSLTNLLQVDTGFHHAGMLEVDYDFSRLPIPESGRVAYRKDMLEKIRAIPGVEAAAAMNIVPLSGSGWNDGVWMEGQDRTGKADSLFNRVSPGYFKTMDTAMLAGRDFDPRDTLSSAHVAIVTETFARRFTGGVSPLGRRFFVEPARGDQPEVCVIVGLVKDAKYRELREDASPIVYLAMSQEAKPDPGDQLLVRTGGALPPVEAAIRSEFNGMGPQISYEFHDFEKQIVAGLLLERLMAALSGVFGMLAVILAMVGLYGVISYTVARRKHEIGIRMALGADRGRISTMILREAGTLLGLGLALGAGLALYAVTFAETLVFGLHPNDPSTFAVATGSLALVAIAASYFPARRAAGLDPMVALRDE